jgi:phage protein D
LELKGLGKRFSGEYYVKKVEHTLGSNGYLTQFDVRRVFDGGK